MPVWTSPWKPWNLLPRCPLHIGIALEQHHGYALWYFVMATLWLCCGCCYGCCISQERGCVMATITWFILWREETVSSVPTAPHVFFQPLSLSLAYSGFSKQWAQCEQQDNWHYIQDQQYNEVSDLSACLQLGRRCSFWGQDWSGPLPPISGFWAPASLSPGREDLKCQLTLSLLVFPRVQSFVL